MLQVSVKVYEISFPSLCIMMKSNRARTYLFGQQGVVRLGGTVGVYQAQRGGSGSHRREKVPDPVLTL